MRRRLSQPWRVVKWMGVVGLFIVASGWLVSEFRAIVYVDAVRVDSMRVWFIERGSATIAVLPQTGRNLGWRLDPHSPRVGRKWNYEYLENVTARVWWVIVPLWMGLAAIGVPTILLTVIDRRSPKGHCQQCGYDLTGNESGVCPECGYGV